MSVQDNKFKKFEDEKEFENKNITLNVEEKKDNQVSSDKKKKATPAFLKKMKENKESVAMNFMTGNRNITESVSNEVMTKINDHLQFIGKYFNVELEDVQSKLLCAINPMNTNFHELAEKNPDLYGPFWIYTTLIFLVTFAGNMSNYFNLDEEARVNFKYNFGFIPNAAMFIYGFGFGMPLVIFLIMKFMFKVNIPLVLNICVYGYSFITLAPVLFLCLIPNSILETCFLLVFLVASTYFLLKNMAKFIVEQAERSKNVILGIIVGFQVVLFLTLKFYFFATFTTSK